MRRNIRTGECAPVTLVLQAAELCDVDIQAGEFEGELIVISHDNDRFALDWLTVMAIPYAGPIWRHITNQDRERAEAVRKFSWSRFT